MQRAIWQRWVCAVGVGGAAMLLASAPGCGSGSGGGGDAEDSGSSASDGTTGTDSAAEAGSEGGADAGDSGTTEGGSSEAATVDSGPGVDSAASPDAAGANDAAGDAPSNDAGADVDAGCASVLYASSVAGLDSNPGTQSLPVKTLTHAIALAGADACVTTIDVAPGNYDTATGETFPLVPTNVAIIGDEANKGNAASGAVLISGTGQVAFAPGPNVTLAGLKIVSPHLVTDASYQSSFAVSFSGPGSVLRNSTVSGSDFGVTIQAAAVSVLTGNVITGNVTPGNGVGVYVVPGGSVKAEGNVVTGNDYGLLVSLTATTDFGGGGLGSAGGNVLSCNTVNDVYLEQAPNVELQNDFWDHLSPTTGSGPGVDIRLVGGTASATTTGAALAPNPCP